SGARRPGFRGTRGSRRSQDARQACQKDALIRTAFAFPCSIAGPGCGPSGDVARVHRGVLAALGASCSTFERLWIWRLAHRLLEFEADGLQAFQRLLAVFAFDFLAQARVV